MLLRRISSFCIIISLFLNGCTILENSNVDYYPTSTNRDFRAVIYENTAYYECDPYERTPRQPHIYSVPLGEETPAKDLLKGELIALADSVLIGKTDTHFCAMDLSAEKPEWEKLKASAQYLTHLQKGNLLYLYLRAGKKYYVDVIDLSALSVERKRTVNDIRQVTALGAEFFYLTSEGFYRGDPLKKGAVRLGDATEGEQMYATDNRVFVYRDCALPRVYDCKSSTFGVPELFENKVSLSGPHPEPTGDPETTAYGGTESPVYGVIYEGVVSVKYTDFYHIRSNFYYDIAADQEIMDIHSRYPGFSEGMIGNGGYFVTERSGNRKYYVNQKEYDVSFVDYRSDLAKVYITMNENGAVRLYENAVVTVSFQTGRSAELYHDQQKVVQE